MCGSIVNRDAVNPGKFESGYHHHKTQWFDSSKVAAGAAGSGLVYGSEQRGNSSGKKAVSHVCTALLSDLCLKCTKLYKCLLLS